ncbi:nuclease [Mycolicibacterium doricum]|uniref:Nuclease n=1 Tax=Mycolicibacterium doricum TaxID=126673 RepID=A0A1X1TD26_9MYCO|nr:endonuclease/exonuclease/phosphatase family protein [Mycolicibacterium doricum]MCV7266958.1 endonuclease/exonuclease/phosphatase family protein [Mycolicibacterium doricum]ORV42456.1 nuclease [Mycolicibacterium doricum]BBZ08440.1 nuclease [Mycolicibacterium doricum]
MARKAFSVATFNLYNLQDAGKPMHRGQTWSDAEFDVKIKWTAWQLTTLDADVVGLQELWSKRALDAVLSVNKRLEEEYDVLAEPATGRRIVCGALVRKGLLDGEPEWVDKFPKGVRLELGSDPNDAQAPEVKVAINAFSRPVLRFAVRLRDDQPCTQVFVAHFKSKLPTQMSDEAWFDRNPDLYKPHQKALGAGISTIRRTAEAVALRVLLTDVMRGSQTPVIVLGDINDGHTSNTANILTEQPRYLVGESAGGSDVGLYTAQTLQEYRDTRDVYYTHIYQGLRESLDHVLVSEQFYDNSRKRIWLFDGLAINNDHLNFDNHRDTGTGDHGVVKVTFAYDPA